MFYANIENLSSSQFKRLTGVKREMFTQMLEALNEAKAISRKHPSRGTPPPN
jgi:DNA-binding HxlR family transcriptional regulator